MVCAIGIYSQPHRFLNNKKIWVKASSLEANHVEGDSVTIWPAAEPRLPPATSFVYESDLPTFQTSPFPHVKYNTTTSAVYGCVSRFGPLRLPMETATGVMGFAVCRFRTVADVSSVFQFYGNSVWIHLELTSAPTNYALVDLRNPFESSFMDSDAPVIENQWIVAVFQLSRMTQTFYLNISGIENTGYWTKRTSHPYDFTVTELGRASSYGRGSDYDDLYQQVDIAEFGIFVDALPLERLREISTELRTQYGI